MHICVLSRSQETDKQAVAKLKQDHQMDMIGYKTTRWTWLAISTMQEHERLVGKPSESPNQTGYDLKGAQDLHGQAMDMDKTPGF